MTLDEAIKVLRQHNEKGTSVLRITRGRVLEKELLAQVLDSCEQLIFEKAEYKRLLKAAVEDMTKEADCGICLHDNDGECPIEVTACKFKWRYADEALALIGEDTNVPASKDDKEDNCEMCIICGHKIHYDVETYYDINGAAVCDGCMSTVCEIKPMKDGDTE